MEATGPMWFVYAAVQIIPVAKPLIAILAIAPYRRALLCRPAAAGDAFKDAATSATKTAASARVAAAQTLS